MVLTHGILNSIFVAPCFFLAIQLERERGRVKNRTQENVILFDGICVLCGGAVASLIKIDRKKKLKFSQLQGAFAKEAQVLRRPHSGESVVFLSDGFVYERAEAALQILKKLGGVYQLFAIVLWIIPLFILNLFYDLIAHNRYRIFGKNEICLIPNAKIKDRFIP